MAFNIQSSAFDNNGEIPKQYTCEGQDISPPLSWSDVPEGTKSLVLIIDDPDAPDPRAPKMTWVHWVVYNLPPDATGLDEAASTSGALPAGTEQGINDWKNRGYGGACPPIGRHRYFHKLYALDTRLDTINNPTKSAIESAMKDHVIEATGIVGTYEKSQ